MPEFPVERRKMSADEVAAFQKVERRVLWLLITLMITILGQLSTAAAGFIFFGELKEQIRMNTQARQEGHVVQLEIAKISVKLDTLIKQQQDFAEELTRVAKEQARRTWVIEESRRRLQERSHEGR